MKEKCNSILETSTLPVKKVQKPLFSQEDEHEDIITYSKRQLPIKNMKSNLTHQFEIYDDPTSSINQSIPNNKSLENLQNIKHYTFIEKKNTKMKRHRVFSDIVFTKRDVSFDDNIFPVSYLDRAASLHSITNSFEHEMGNKIRTHDKDKRSPLKRKPLSLISPMTDKNNNFSVFKSDSPSDNEEKIEYNAADNSSCKENTYPEYVSNDHPTDGNLNNDAINEDLIHLFTPQYYWNLIFEKKQQRTDVLLEDFHLLLYDYERLWNHCLKETL